jgi:SAM-dependent methyltransferase
MMAPVSTRWQDTDAPRGEDYDARWVRLADEGQSVHGEADLVDALLGGCDGRRVLDAGCGTGRVARELARRGHLMVGVDADDRMLDTARSASPEMTWITGDLSELDTVVTATFDLVVCAGNVMIFLEPGTEGRVLRQLADRLAPEGVLVAGFSVAPDRLPLPAYDALAGEAGLTLLHRWSTWAREPYAGGDYAVSVHGRTATTVPNRYAGAFRRPDRRHPSTEE